MTTASTREPLFTPKFFALWSFSFIAFLSAFQLIPVIPFRILALGGTKGEAGWFLAVYTFASAFSAPLIGAVADHVGRRRLLIIASLAFVVFSIGYGVVTRLPLLLAIAAIHGALWSGLMSSSSAIMTDYIPESRRTEGLAYWGMSSTAAIATAPSVGLWVYRFGWLVLCGELAFLAAIMAVWSMILVERDAVASSARAFPSRSELFDWRVTQVALSLFAVAVGYGGVTSYVAILSHERHIEHPALFFNVFASMIIVTRVATARLGDRYGEKALLYPCLAIMPFGLAAVALASTTGHIVLAAILFGAGFGGAYPAFVTFVLKRTATASRARTFGSIIWAFDTGIGSGSLIIGTLAQHLGFTVAFSIAAVFSCLAIPIFLVTSPRLKLA